MSAVTFPIERPALSLLATEPWRAAKELVSLALMRGNVTPIGDGHPVIIYPGLAADGRSVAPLRKHCRSLGYVAMDWGLGYNTGPQGDVDRWLEDLASHTHKLMANSKQTATLIGWSLGGLYAREVAKMLKPHVRQVITIGTPFKATVDQTNVGWLYRLLARPGAGVDPALSKRLRTPPPVPTLSIYSRTDGVVPWQTCRHDKASPLIEDVEIQGSHMGMGWNPAVLKVVADRLSRRSARTSA